MIRLYTWSTPNGVKISIALEELGLDYEVITVDINKDEQFSPEFLSISPNNKIPAIIDPDGPGGVPMPLFESGAILLYLAEKTGKLIGSGPRDRWRIIQWLMFQMGGIGPMFGQVGFFHAFAGKEIEDPRPPGRGAAEKARPRPESLDVLRAWLVPTENRRRSSGRGSRGGGEQHSGGERGVPYRYPFSRDRWRAALPRPPPARGESSASLGRSRG